MKQKPTVDQLKREMIIILVVKYIEGLISADMFSDMLLVVFQASRIVDGKEKPLI